MVKEVTFLINMSEEVETKIQTIKVLFLMNIVIKFPN